MGRRRYLGTTRFFNVATNNEFSNGLDLQFDGDELDGAITSAIEPGRKVPLFETGAEARAFRKALLKMEREDYRARRQAGEFAIPKPSRGRVRGQRAPNCELCSDRGGNEDEEGNWVTCPHCSS